MPSGLANNEHEINRNGVFALMICVGTTASNTAFMNVGRSPSHL
jgi:hypothetical protein